MLRKARDRLDITREGRSGVVPETAAMTDGSAYESANCLGGRSNKTTGLTASVEKIAASGVSTALRKDGNPFASIKALQALLQQVGPASHVPSGMALHASGLPACFRVS